MLAGRGLNPLGLPGPLGESDPSGSNPGTSNTLPARLTITFSAIDVKRNLCYPENMAAYREPHKMTTSRVKINRYEESRRMDREAIALLAGEPITAESLAAAYRKILGRSALTSQSCRRTIKIERKGG